jgi:glucose/mannose-6-phosphate isomerase
MAGSCILVRMTDLDDLEVIKALDPSDALGVIAEQYQQLAHQFDADLSGIKAPKQIVLAGMGGSALAALVAKAWLTGELSVPFEIVRDYSVPGYVGPDTLVIASSYSGNTEETVAALNSAEQQGAQIVVLAAGGELGKRAQQKGYPFLELPSGLQPRYTTFYGLRALVTIFCQLGLLDDARLVELQAASETLEVARKDWLPAVSASDNPAKQIAQKLAGTTPVIYGGPLMKAAAYKWKIGCNENAKNVAFWDEFSEFDHNEIMGWLGPVDTSSFTVLELRSSLEHPEIIRRYDISNLLLDAKMPDPIRVDVLGDTPLSQLLWAIQLGDFVSLYLALLNNIDPTPVALMEELKRDLAEG